MIIGQKVVLREKRLADAWNDYTWETDLELAQLDASPILAITFSQYLSSYANELRYSSTTSRRFAVDTLDSKHIGNCSYYNISESKGSTELGIMIGNRDYWNKGWGTDTITTLQAIADNISKAQDATSNIESHAEESTTIISTLKKMIDEHTEIEDTLEEIDNDLEQTTETEKKDDERQDPC